MNFTRYTMHEGGLVDSIFLPRCLEFLDAFSHSMRHLRSCLSGLVSAQRIGKLTVFHMLLFVLSDAILFNSLCCAIYEVLLCITLQEVVDYCRNRSFLHDLAGGYVYSSNRKRTTYLVDARLCWLKNFTCIEGGYYMNYSACTADQSTRDTHARLIWHIRFVYNSCWNFKIVRLDGLKPCYTDWCSFSWLTVVL